MLNGLKKEVTKCHVLDQSEKSKLRIQIEGLLIDLNEELFLISETLSAAYSTKQDSKEGLLFRAQEHEKRKNKIMNKIKKEISNSPMVQLVRDPNSASPQKKSKTPIRDQNKSDVENLLLDMINKKPNSIESFSDNSEPEIETKT